MAIKLNMEKAFDFIEWDFLFAIMKALGYSNKWINLVRECITTATFSVLISGSPRGFFKAERGLRQGDLISPFLFILCTKVLSRLIARSEAMGTLKGLKVSRNCPPISHLLFADDLIIFGKAEETVARNISRNLDKYQEWSGQ
ncbi:secreted RxLR effector protein 78-like [Carya illinoinensis]|uniref:secreted RxLR effector protein 78-like n=1 Tax=Carya illinoinensis TaxID=32201 RepID=UPI001C726715|nr:secreted RxLR effector protein 78-like [Carya illinoinensis]